MDASQQKIGKAFRLALNKLPAFLLALALFLAGLAIMLAVLYLAAKQFTPDPLAAVYDWLKSYTAVDLIKLAVVLVGLHLLGKAGEVWKYLSYAASFHRLVSRVIISAIVPSILAIPVKLYLWTLDRYYLWQGRIKA